MQTNINTFLKTNYALHVFIEHTFLIWFSSSSQTGFEYYNTITLTLGKKREKKASHLDSKSLLGKTVQIL